MLNSLSVLPLSPSELQNGIEDAVLQLQSRGFTEEESLLKLGYDFDVWLDDGTARDRFPVDLALILEKASWAGSSGQGRSNCYASLVVKFTGRFTKTRRDAEFIYTFKPRGEVANLIFGVFPPELAPGGNPMLNNFKAVNRITLDWADSRPDNREQAKALVEIVEGLSSLAYSPRVQISSLLRKAIVRYIEINTPAPIQIARQTDFEAIKRFVRGVSGSQTCTRGVIEQRVVDFLAAIEYPLPEWRSRGLGDPVNASNSSSKKLGECDFQNIAERKCVALEAHAGRLTDVYVREHLRTLRINLPSRLEEWSRISELSDWRLYLRFLVHEDARSGTDVSVPDVVDGPVEVLTYMQYFERLLPVMESDIDGTIRLFNQWVVAVLDASNTPVTTKQTANFLLLD